MDEQPQSPQEESESRRGTARDRIRRRRERRETQRTGAVPRQSTGQVAPQREPSRFDLSDLPLPMGTIRNSAIIGGALLIVIVMIVLLRTFNPPDSGPPPNAIWLGTGWSYGRPSPDEVEGLVRQLRSHDIGKAHVWVSYLKEDMVWSGKRSDRDPVTDQVISDINPETGEQYTNTLVEMEANVLYFVEQYKAAYPEGLLYGWISYPTNLDSDGYTMDDPVIHTRIAELAAVLVTSYGFDGVYLNIEPVFNGDENFLQLLRVVRATIGDEVPIAVAIPPDWRPSGDPIPFAQTITGTLEWSVEYKQNVALLSDEMLVMAYQSGLTTPEDYSEWMAYQVNSYARAVAELDIETQVYIGVPTYAAELPGHDPDVENVLWAVNGILNGLETAGDSAESVAGLAIYAEWETDDVEWAMFRDNWVNR